MIHQFPEPSIIESTYREVDKQRAKQDRKRKADLRVRDVIARERIFTLLYCAMLIVSMIVGTVLGYWFGRM